MRNRLAFAFTLALALVLVVAPAAQAMTFRGTGTTADAWWEDWSEEGAAYRRTDVGGGFFKDFVRDDGTEDIATAGEVVWVFSSSFDPRDPDTTADDVYRECFGLLDAADIAVSSKLEGASVDALVECTVTEWIGTEPWPSDPEAVEPNPPTNAYDTVVAVDLDWTGDGAIVKSTSKSRWDDPYGSGKQRSTDVSRSATISGTVVDAEGNDLTYGLDPFASLAKFRYAERSFFSEPMQ